MMESDDVGQGSFSRILFGLGIENIEQQIAVLYTHHSLERSCICIGVGTYPASLIDLLQTEKIRYFGTSMRAEG